MMKTTFALMVATMIGCGGGVDGDKKLAELSVQETKDACLELAEDFPEKTVMCSAQVSITVGVSATECQTRTVAGSNCTATVDDARACTQALYGRTMAETCTLDGPLPESCMKLTACSGG